MHAARSDIVEARQTLQRQIKAQAWLIGVSVFALVLSGVVLGAAVFIPLSLQRRMDRQETAGKDTDKLVKSLIDFIQQDLNIRKEQLHASEQRIYRPGS